MSSKKSSQKRNKRPQQKATGTMDETYTTGANGGAVKRIRSPHPNDVLSGRGGGINSHVGNQKFREWVRVRKDDYTLAPSKTDKARVAREVVALVEEQVPPGRFLQKDPTSIGSSSWWVEIDDDRIMAKTSQALREGAPSIRAAHKDDFEEEGGKQTGRRNRKTGMPSQAAVVEDEAVIPGTKRKYTVLDETTMALQFSSEQAILELRANAEAARHDKEIRSAFEHPEKRVRVDYKGHAVYPSDETPPLLPMSAPSHMEPLGHAMLPPPAELPQRPLRLSSSDSQDGLKRAHSLACSELGLADWQHDEEFVNPFDDESELDWKKNGTPVPVTGLLRETMLRETSTASNGDMGGIGALLRPDNSVKSGSSGSNGVGGIGVGALMRSESSPKSGSSGSSGVRSKNSVGNMSSRYEDYSEQGRNILFRDDGWSSTPPFWLDLEGPPIPVSPERDDSVEEFTNFFVRSDLCRSLTSVLSDLPEGSNSRQQGTDFTEGMEMSYDALHPDLEEESTPTKLYPYRGNGLLKLRRSSASLSSRGLDGRQ
jgi:hypothetical protein